MKPGTILIGLAVIGLAAAATPDTQARAWGSWHSTSYKLAGSSYSITGLPDGTASSVPPFTSIQNALVLGRYGRAQLRSTTFAGELAPAAPGQCPDGLPFRGSLTISFVITYVDGSLLSGATQGENFYCTDGSTFAASAAGTITGGARRFEGATGTWEVAADVIGARVTGDLDLDID